MAIHTISVELKDDQLAALAAAANGSALDRNAIIESALEDHLASEAYYRESVEAGLRDVESGNTVPHEEVLADFEHISVTS